VPPDLNFGDDQVGTYNFFNRIDLGGVFTTRLSVEMEAFPFYESSPFIDVRPGNVDTWQNWDDQDEDASGQVMIRVRQTNDDPAGVSPTWTDWAPFVVGEYIGRGFEFQAVLVAPLGQQVGIEELCITADLTAKQDQGSDIAWTQPSQTINFLVKFYLPPSISIQMQNAVTGDYTKITSKSRTGFTYEIRNSSNAIVTAARTIDWQAAGY